MIRFLFHRDQNGGLLILDGLQFKYLAGRTRYSCQNFIEQPIFITNFKYTKMAAFHLQCIHNIIYQLLMQADQQQIEQRLPDDKNDKEASKQSSKSLKIKVGIFFGYNGEKFLGMQYQRDTQNTIQNILHKVFLQNGFILKSNAESLRRIKWSRAGRTDKRVHALCNGISVNLEFGQRYIINRAAREIDFDKVVKDLNGELPFDIRIFTMKKLGKNFDMRHDAQTRIYNYIAPLKLFLPIEQFRSNKSLNQLQKHEIITKLNDLVENYLGTHNFHNFTKGYKMKDPRCDRYMIKMHAQLVEEQTIFKYLQQNYENEQQRKQNFVSFVRFTLVGQSFIYHQIRKMIGLLIKIFSEGLEGKQTIAKAFELQKYDLYLAPGEGLYLNRMTFEGYNKKKEKEFQVELNQDDQKRITQYRAYLQSKILHHQMKEKVFTNWLLNHDKIMKDESDEEKSINQE